MLTLLVENSHTMINNTNSIVSNYDFLQLVRIRQIKENEIVYFYIQLPITIIVSVKKCEIEHDFVDNVNTNLQNVCILIIFLGRMSYLAELINIYLSGL